MFRLCLLVGVICALGAIVVFAQPPERPAQNEKDGDVPGPPRDDEGGPPQGPLRASRIGRVGRPGGPLMEALDTNGDGELSAEEIANAPASLKKLDKNGDGKLTPDELRLKRRPVGYGGNFRPGREGARPEGPNDGGPGPGPGGVRDENNGPGDDPPGARAEGGGGEPGGPGAGNDPGERPGQGGQPGPRRANGRLQGGRGPGGPLSPQRFVEHAMRFDADGDGKLDRAELLKFAQDLARHAPRARGPANRNSGRGGPGGPGGPGPDGAGPDGPGNRGQGGPPPDDQDSNRPQRPDRPSGP